MFLGCSLQFCSDVPFLKRLVIPGKTRSRTDCFQNCTFPLCCFLHVYTCLSETRKNASPAGIKYQ